MFCHSHIFNICFLNAVNWKLHILAVLKGDG